jgi:hypothetical protein
MKLIRAIIRNSDRRTLKIVSSKKKFQIDLDNKFGFICNRNTLFDLKALFGDALIYESQIIRFEHQNHYLEANFLI